MSDVFGADVDRRKFDESAVFRPDETDSHSDQEGEMMWCLHCERCYPYGWYRPVERGGKTYHMCPYEGCDGDVVMDGWPWSKPRGANPEYPEEPEIGKRYPLYAE